MIGVETPSFSLAELPRLLRAHAANRLTYFLASGEKRTRAYPEVYEDVLAALSALRAKGLPMRAGQRAVVAGPPGYDWLLAALACFFAGVEVVALPETLEDGDAGASIAGLAIDVAIGDAHARGLSALRDVPRASLEDLPHAPRAEGGESLDLCPRPPSLVAFTSGSTSMAKLKSFRIAPESTAAFIDAFTSSFGLAHDDVWVVCHSFSHIVHFEYVLGGLGWGYDITLADPVRVVMSAAELRPSALVSVPSVYEQLAERIRRAKGRPGSGQGAGAGLARVVGDRLKVMIIGAAPSSAELQRFLREAGLPLYEGYGMSETNMIACNVPRDARPGWVGRAFPGVDIALRDDGVVLARPRVLRASAYLNVPADESSETFAADGWVVTGDLGEVEDGYLRIVGRTKEIVVTSAGKKVNVAALEARLRELPDVGHALVYGDDRPFMVAVFAPSAHGTLPSAEELRARLDPINRALPHHERIVDFVRLEGPLDVEGGLLTRSGKPRRALVAERWRDAIARLYA